MMGLIIEFPAELAHRKTSPASGNEPAEIVILPVVRIERYDDAPDLGEPEDGNRNRRRRRRARS